MKNIFYPGVSSLALLSLTTACKQQEKTPQIAPMKPNIVFIYADDLGYGDLECYGATRVHTPNVNRLASEGILCTNAHAAASTSTPSRYSVLTGEYAWRHPDTDIAPGNAGMIIRPEKYTLPDMLKQAGYTTAAIGKWHLGLGDKTGEQDWNKQLTPALTDIGFDYSYIMAATADRVPCVYVENGLVVNLDPDDPIEVSYKKNFPGEPTGKERPDLLYKQKSSHGHDMTIVNGIGRIGFMKGGKKALWTDETIADSITSKALGFIEKHQSEPFFLYFATNDVHVPRVPNPRFVGQTEMGPRGDAIAQFDWSVGQILAALDSLGLADNTLVILSSDNGPVVDDGYADRAEELLGDHKPWGPFRGGKYSAFEAGSCIPFIVRWPGMVQPSVSSSLISQLDMVASLASLTGTALPEGAAPDSYDQLNTWLGRTAKGRDFVVEEASNRTLSVVSGKWKYIEPHAGPAMITWGPKIETGNSKDPQLYDLVADKNEQNNLAEKYPDKVKELQALLADVRAGKLNRK